MQLAGTRTHQTSRGMTIPRGGHRIPMTPGRVIECHQLGFFPALIGASGPRRQRPKIVPLLTKLSPTLLGLVSTRALLGVGDQRNLKAIGSADQTRTVLTRGMTIRGRERRRQFVALCRRTHPVSFPLKDRTKALVGQADLTESIEVLAGLAITGVQTHPTNHSRTPGEYFGGNPSHGSNGAQHPCEWAHHIRRRIAIEPLTVTA